MRYYELEQLDDSAYGNGGFPTLVFDAAGLVLGCQTQQKRNVLGSENLHLDTRSEHKALVILIHVKNVVKQIKYQQVSNCCALAVISGCHRWIDASLIHVC